ncbi:MAG: hypothetical protein ACK6DK_13675 [Gemmatimonadota bacterium]
MDTTLRDSILRALDTLPDDKGYQVLDYVSFLESRYASHAPPPDNVFTRLASAVEDTLRASKVNATTVAQAMGMMNKAMGVLSGVAAAGQAVVSDVASVGKQVASDIAAAAAKPSPTVTPPAAPANDTAPSDGQAG